MFRVTVSTFRTLGIILLIAGAGMMFPMLATADDHEIGVGEAFVPARCSNCTQQIYPNCFHANGCLCRNPFNTQYCRVHLTINDACICR